MLSIGKLGRGQENYYLATVAQGVEDYYTGGGEAPGEWTGTGAARLGLHGEVDAEDLRLLLGGVDPRTGAPLGGRTRSDRVPGWDLTFSAPKSVSVLYALGNDRVTRDVIDAHQAAVTAGIAYLETHATVTRRRIDGQIQQVRGDGLVIAAFRHRTSRAGDPQLHTHCLVGNVVARSDGGWGALHSRVVYQHARTAGFVYQAVLRGELSVRLGVEWGDVVKGQADIAGIDRRLLDLFSKRRREIVAAMAERGVSTPLAARTVTLETRRAKAYDVDPDMLRERWRVEAAALADSVDVRGVFNHRVPVLARGAIDEIADRMLSSYGLTQQHASFDRRDVMRGWCEGLPPGLPIGLASLEGLVEGLLDNRRVIDVIGHDDDEPVRRWSTVEMLNIERRLLERAEEGQGIGVGIADPAAVDTACADGVLSDEQEHMVRTITTSGNRVDVVVGRAGTGKTFALQAAVTAWRDSGYHPVGVAIAARAANELEHSARLPSTTMERFLNDCERTPGALDRNTVVVVDEAGMVDTRRLARLLANVDAAGAKVVLVGDHHQLPAVDAGGAFGALVQRLDVVELTENRRQIEAWERAALDQLRTGPDREGLVAVIDRYDRAGRVHIGDTSRDVHTAMVNDWHQARTDGDSVMMIALRRHDVDELNARARAVLVDNGVVAREGLSMGGRTFAPGDRIVCLRNDRRIGVHNAMFGTVTAADDHGLTVNVDGTSKPRHIPADYLADGHVAHGYASTIHKAQGATYDRALILGDDALYRQAGYTALSRGRISNDIYLVNDSRTHDHQLDQHGTPDHDPPRSRLAVALAHDAAERLAIDEQRRDLAVNDTSEGTEPQQLDDWRTLEPAAINDAVRLDAIHLDAIARQALSEPADDDTRDRIFDTGFDL